MTNQAAAEQLMAEMVVSFLVEAYGSAEAAAIAVAQELEEGDRSSVEAGVLASVQSVRKMAEAAHRNPSLMAELVLQKVGS